MDQEQGAGESLREVRDTAARVAREAADALDENVRAAQGGQETDYAFRLPPDVAEADRVRGADDVDLMRRQEDVAQAQRSAAELLAQNAERLRRTGQELGRTGSAVAGNRGDLGEIRENVRELGEQLAQARDQVAQTPVPRVDGAPDGEGDGGR